MDCEWCSHPDHDGTVETCTDDCGCPPCENERALDEDADMHFES